MSDPLNQADAVLTTIGARITNGIKLIFRGDFVPLLVICSGGLAGGALSGTAYGLAGAPLSENASLLTRGGLGVVAAGFGTLILANSDRRDRLRLFFFALLCGLCYPSVIGQAMSDVERRATEGTKNRDLTVQKSVIEETPAGNIRPEIKKQIESNIVKSIKEATAVDKTSAETIEEITELGKAARENGYDKAAIEAAAALNKLNASDKVVDAVINEQPIPAGPPQ